MNMTLGAVLAHALVKACLSHLELKHTRKVMESQKYIRQTLKKARFAYHDDDRSTTVGNDSIFDDDDDIFFDIDDNAEGDSVSEHSEHGDSAALLLQ